jgi:hypothetical protein
MKRRKRARMIRELRTMPAMVAGDRGRGFVRSSWGKGSKCDGEGRD